MLLLTIWLTGCTITSRSIGGGYSLRTTTYTSWEPARIEQSLFFRGQDGVEKRVWENFTGPILVEGNTAVFFGRTNPGDYKLFAVKDGAPCLEVGKAILEFEAQRKGVDISAFVEQNQLHSWYLNRSANGFELEYSRWLEVNQPHEHISLSWDELWTITRRIEGDTTGARRDFHGQFSYGLYRGGVSSRPYFFAISTTRGMSCCCSCVSARRRTGCEWAGSAARTNAQDVGKARPRSILSHTHLLYNRAIASWVMFTGGSCGVSQKVFGAVESSD